MQVETDSRDVFVTISLAAPTLGPALDEAGRHAAGEVVMVIRTADKDFAASAVEVLVDFTLKRADVLHGWRIIGSDGDPIADN